MRLSTLVELTGFGFLIAAAWHFGTVPGLIVTGAVLLFIGALIEDDVAELPLRRAASSTVALARRLPRRKRGTEPPD